ncbi:MAG: ABC-type sugar transport system, periplasmic component [Microbacterium sp.]|nr:ABC-type sugar transport system, periplasmic component [Microbacterium sp.]
MKAKKIVAGFALVGAIALTTAGCAGGTNAGGGGGDDKVITVGFAQTGSESGWRSANTESMKEAFSEANGFNLIFNAADNKPEAQIAAVRSFINQGGKWVADNFGKTPTNLVVLEGTTGSSAATDRAAGFDEAIAGTDIKVLDSQTGNFTRAEGKTVMEGFLQKYGSTINVLFAHNDDMGLGALDAIKAAGLKPGTDIKIVTIDAVKDGMTALADGEFNYIVECNPLLGDKVADVVKKVVAGESVDKSYIVEDQAFDQEQAKAALPDRKY